MTSTTVEYDLLAPYYDELTGVIPDTDRTVEFLAEHAGEGRILELGVGTGRLACPLSSRGFDVTGLDNSAGMLSRLRARGDSTKVDIVLGSFTEMPVEGEFSLVYAVYNTLFYVLSQDEQLTAIRLVARHLGHDGTFVVETDLPDLTRPNRTLTVGGLERQRVFLQAAIREVASQRIRSQTVIVSEQGIQILPLTLRYFWPSELDLMAHLSGLRLIHRYGSWDKSPYTGDSTRQISVFRRAE